VESVAALPWNQRQLCRGISGSFRLESMAGLLWNRWQLCYGISGRIHLESVAALPWNTHPMMALGEKRLYLRDDGIGICFREGGNPNQITERMGSLRGGMRTNAPKTGDFPTSRQLWELKYTVFKCMYD